jgi:nucleoside-diphosphate-sugar epimerase
MTAARASYLVTGAAGFIGSHLTEALLGAGHDVVAVDRFSDYYERSLKERNCSAFALQRLDLAEAALDDLVAGVDGIFHLAGQPGVRRSWGEDFAAHARDNLLASQRVFEAAAAARKRVVFASSSSIYGDASRYPVAEDAPANPASPYGVAKLACEHLARAYATSAGLDVVMLRYFTVYGPRQRPDMAFSTLLTALVENEPFRLNGTGSQSRSFTYVHDVVEATRLAMTLAPTGAVYNVGGGDEAALSDVIALAERLTGRTLAVRIRPHAAGDVLRTAADTRRIRAEIGWHPSTSLQTGLRAQWEWFLADRGENEARGIKRLPAPPGFRATA